MEKGFMAKDVPADVMWAWGMMQQRMMGVDMYRRIEEIKKEYPEWFKKVNVVTDDHGKVVWLTDEQRANYKKMEMEKVRVNRFMGHDKDGLAVYMETEEVKNKPSLRHYVYGKMMNGRSWTRRYEREWLKKKKKMEKLSWYENAQEKYGKMRQEDYEKFWSEEHDRIMSRRNRRIGASEFVANQEMKQITQVPLDPDDVYCDPNKSQFEELLKGKKQRPYTGEPMD